MNSYFKAVVHTAATYLAMWLPSLIHTTPGWDVSIGVVVAGILNFIVSYTIPTTTGASAKQNQ